MKIETLLFTSETAHVFRNLYPLYLHDLSAFNSAAPNEHGILESNPYRTLEEQMEAHNAWLELPDSLFPYLIRVDGAPAGFCLVATHPHIERDSDYLIHEFFLLHAYRGRGVGQQAAVQAFDRFRGRWHVYVLPDNLRAVSFWRKTISEYTSGDYEEDHGPTIFAEEHVIFRLTN